MRILFVGNTVFGHTGYATQLKNISEICRSLGHELGYAPFYGLEGGGIVIDGVPHFPPLRSTWGDDMIGAHVKLFNPDIVMNLHDIWVLPQDYRKRLDRTWVSLFPVDTDPAVPGTVRLARTVDYPVVFSKFGQRMMLEAGVKCDYIPHCIDCEVFKPGDRAAARKEIGLPEDKFICLMVGANKGYPSRKAFPEQLLAFARFYKTRPDAILYLHTTLTPVGHPSDGIDLRELLLNLGISSKAIFSTSEHALCLGCPATFLASLYQSADVLLHASYSEGFGLCAAEGLACGLPTILTNFSSMSELAFDKELLVEPLQQCWNSLGSWQVIPSVNSIQAAIEQVYDFHDSYDEKREDRAKWIACQYSIPVVKEQFWEPFLERVRDKLTQKLSKAAD